ncbi:MAG: RidA family protein [Paludibacteraceae bacterium]|nr:RidA family protein [Paludibacteraceae bacterium]
MKRIISTTKAPAAIGPYSQAVEANGTLYMSGQIPVNPENGKVDAVTIEQQAEQVLLNIGAVLEAAGYTYADVVKSTMYLTDMKNFAAANEVYKKFYTQDFPARSSIGIKELPLGVLVEIETIAVK